MMYVNRVFWRVLVLCAMALSGPTANAQSSAAMQVCADILAQYGIAPEGCNFGDEEAKEPVNSRDETIAATTSATLGTEEQVLEENNIFFRVGGDKLDTLARQKIETLGKVLNTAILQNACLRLVGHSDTSGPADINRKMGLKRAEKVAALLGPKLSRPDRIQEVLSDGEDNPLPGYNPESAKQRRVTIFARDCPKP